MRGSPAAILLTVGLLLSEPPPVLHGGEAPTKLFIVHGSMNVSAAPAWIAKSQGFFRKYGFEVDPVFVIGGRAAQAMIARAESVNRFPVAQVDRLLFSSKINLVICRLHLTSLDLENSAKLLLPLLFFVC